MSRSRYHPYRLEKRAGTALRSHSTRQQQLFFWNFLDEDIYNDDSKIITELRDVIVEELRRLTSQIVDRAINDPGTVPLLAVTLRKRTSHGIIYSKRCSWKAEGRSVQ